MYQHYTYDRIDLLDHCNRNNSIHDMNDIYMYRSSLDLIEIACPTACFRFVTQILLVGVGGRESERDTRLVYYQ